MENYELLHTALIYDRIPVSEYVSRRTGLTVFVAEFEGPTVHAAFHIINEAFDDDGVANALRHMIFMGSEDFPYKDIPNLIATRSLGSETTSQIKFICTTYTIQSVFDEGLLPLLPIIGDYILFPLLTEEAFITEVHHITKEGQDAGIMYEDLQCSEKSYIPPLLLALTKSIYPGKCSYASNIQGTTESLRESVTIAKVREYHKKFYRPENLKIIITGNVKPEDVFKALEQLEEKIISKGPRGPFERPFQTLPPPLSEQSKDVVIKYLADNKTVGQFYMAWRTGSCITDSYMLLAITMLLEYLTESPVSPLLKEFVKTESTFNNKLEYHMIKNKESCVYIFIRDVPIDKMSEIKPKLQAVFKNIVENKDIDMKHLETIITQFKFKQIISMENFPYHVIQSALTRYMTFGSHKDFQHCINSLPELDKLLAQPQSFWLDILQKYFVQNKNVALKCIPASKEEKQSVAIREKERIEAQRRNLTEAELKQKEEILEKAIALKNREPPPELLISVPFPTMESIKHHNIERYSSDTNHNQRIDLSQTPVFTYFDHLNASTVFLQAFLGTSNISADLQNYLPLLFECLMELPIERNGIIIPHEEVLAQLEADTIYRWTDARSYNMPHLAAVCVEVEASKYEIGLRWLREILYKTVFTLDRVKSIATRMLKQLRKDCSSDYIYTAINAMCFSKDSPLVICGELQQNKFLTNLIEKLDANDGKDVLDNIEKVRKIITEPSKVTLYIAANLDCIKNPVESIDGFLPPELPPSKKKQRLNSPFHYDFLQFDDSLNGVIIGGDNHPFARIVTKTITSYIDPDYAALIVYMKYLDHDEGPLRKQLQGTVFWFRVDVEEGLLYLNFSKTKNLIETYKKAREVISKQLEIQEWDETLLKIAQRSILYDLIEDESTIMDLVLSSRKAYFHNLDYTYRCQLYDSVTKVTIADLQHVREKYVAPLFNPKKSKIAAVVRPSKIMELAEEFNKLGLDLTVYKSLEDSL